MLVPLTTPALFWAHEAFRQDNPRIVPVARLVLQGASRACPNTQLVQMRQQVARILVDPVGAGALELVFAVAA